MCWPWVWGHPRPCPRPLGWDGRGSIPAPGGRAFSWGSLCQRAAPKGQVQLVQLSQLLISQDGRSQVPHPPQGCPGSSCPSPTGFVTTPGLQERGSLPQPTPALRSQKEPKPTPKPTVNPTAEIHLCNRASTPLSSQISGAKQRKTSQNIRNSSAWEQRGGHGELGQPGRGWDH